MSLDGLEILMEVEDEFGVKIPDGEAERIITIGDLAQVVRSKLTGVEWIPSHLEPPCPSARSFYAIRRILCEQLRIDRRCLSPQSSLKELLPSRSRRAVWRALAQVKLQSPPLTTAAWVKLLIAPVIIGAALYLGFATAMQIGVPAMIAVISLVVGAGFLLIWSQARVLPTACTTLGDLARFTYAPWPRNEAARPVHESEVLNHVRRIVSLQLAIAIDELTAETKFIDICAD